MAIEKEKLTSLFDVVNDTLAKINVDDIDENNSQSFNPVPPGYYFCQLEVAPELTESKTTHRPMFKCTFRILNDGVNLENTEVLTGTKGRLEWKNYMLDEERGLKNFISDMMKFKVDKDGNSLPAEVFKSAQTMAQAIQLLEEKRVFIMISEADSKSKKDADGNPLKDRFINLITFTRAEQLGLSMN